tara:strand:+ start:124 stop:618 length:495 start_codon:yes stop_codon:yes gene_type:complete
MSPFEDQNDNCLKRTLQIFYGLYILILACAMPAYFVDKVYGLWLTCLVISLHVLFAAISAGRNHMNGIPLSTRYKDLGEFGQNVLVFSDFILTGIMMLTIGVALVFYNTDAHSKALNVVFGVCWMSTFVGSMMCIFFHFRFNSYTHVRVYPDTRGFTQTNNFVQ